MKTLSTFSALALALTVSSFAPAVRAQEAPHAPPPAQPYAPAPPPYAAPPYGAPAYGAPAYGAPGHGYAPAYGYPAPAYGYYPTMPVRRGRAVVGHRDVERPNTALWGTGLALFLAGWVLDFAAFTPLANAISDDRPPEVEEDSWAWSLLPLVGPWIQLGLEAPHPAIPITLGLLQLAGAGMIIAGLVTRQTIRVPIYEGDPEAPGSARVDLGVAPSLGGGVLTVALAHR